VQIKFRLFTIIFVNILFLFITVHNLCSCNNLVKYMQINHDNFSEMFSLSLSLHLPYYAEVCNEFAMLIPAS